MLTWRERYRVAILETDPTMLPPLLYEAINAVLDQIEETRDDRELKELNEALNALRSRRGPDRAKAA